MVAMVSRGSVGVTKTRCAGLTSSPMVRRTAYLASSEHRLRGPGSNGLWGPAVRRGSAHTTARRPAETPCPKPELRQSSHLSTTESWEAALQNRRSAAYISPTRQRQVTSSIMLHMLHVYLLAAGRELVWAARRLGFEQLQDTDLGRRQRTRDRGAGQRLRCRPARSKPPRRSASVRAPQPKRPDPRPFRHATRRRSQALLGPHPPPRSWLTLTAALP